MKIPVALLSVAMALGVASCAKDNSQTQTTDNRQLRSGDNGNVAPGQSGNAGAGTRIEGDAPTRDAQFTLFCDAIRGPDHVIAATAIKDRLMGRDGLRNWHILHTNDQSTIFYGYYRTFNDKEHDPAETARAQADLHAIQAITNVQGDRLFAKAIFLSINDPDPDAPPQWNLANTPPTAYWSLQIAAYRGIPERKAAAVEAVRQARNMGVEAYYYHGDTISSVCIGAWPRESIKEQDLKSGRTPDPHDTLFVPSGPLPPNTSPDLKIHGERVTIEAPKLEVLDGTLAKAIRDYPEHAVNNKVTEKTYKDESGHEHIVASPSFIVLIPHSDAPPAPIIPLPPVGVSANNGADQAAHDILDNPTTGGSPAGRGQLRGLDHP